MTATSDHAEQLRQWTKRAAAPSARPGRGPRLALPSPAVLAGGFDELAECEREALMTRLRAQPHGTTRAIVAALGTAGAPASLADAAAASWSRKLPRHWVRVADRFAVNATILGRGLDAAAILTGPFGDLYASDCPAGGGIAREELLERVGAAVAQANLDDQLAVCAIEAIEHWDPHTDRSPGATVVVALLAEAGRDEMLPPLLANTLTLVTDLASEGDAPVDQFVPPLVAQALAAHASTDAARAAAAELADPAYYLAA